MSYGTDGQNKRRHYEANTAGVPPPIPEARSDGQAPGIEAEADRKGDRQPAEEAEQHRQEASCRRERCSKHACYAPLNLAPAYALAFAGIFGSTQASSRRRLRLRQSRGRAQRDWVDPLRRERVDQNTGESATTRRPLGRDQSEQCGSRKVR